MKVFFDLARNQVSIEGDGPDLMSLLQLVRDVAPKVSEIRIVTTPAAAAPTGGGDQNGGGNGGERLVTPRAGTPGMREFARSLNPTNLSERIIAIAAFQSRHGGRPDFSPKEMGEWFVICGFQKPAQMSVALFDAKRKYGYLDKAGHGRWKLATGGENEVTRRLEENGGAA